LQQLNNCSLNINATLK